MKFNYFDICERLKKWFQRNNYRGIDPYLIDQKVFRYKAPFVKQIRFLLKPFHSFIPPYVFYKCSPVFLPKSAGLIINGNISLYKLTGNKDYLKETYGLIDLLKENRSPHSRYFCWGWTFEWGGKHRYPYNYPLAIVTSEICLSLLRHYECDPNEEILSLCRDTINFLIRENGFLEKNDSICFYFSFLDRELLPNINAYCLATLLKYSKFSGENYTKIITKVQNFMIDTQNKDGSWVYQLGSQRIDNRHTGFVLSALKWANEIIEDKMRTKMIEKGWGFYMNNLFEGVIPKWSINQTYPCDIHDVAQSIITAVELGHLDFAEEIIKFALEKLFNGRDEFYYKLYKNGGVNKTVFFRWNQAWMFRALTLFLEKKNEESSISLP